MTKTHLGILVGLVAVAGLLLASSSFGQSPDKGMGDQKMKADGGHKGHGGMAKPMHDAGM
jgi:hypothetical protein